MRKSERLRLLEIEVIRLGMQLQIMQSIVDSMLENTLPRTSEMDAGKWYNRKQNGYE